MEKLNSAQIREKFLSFFKLHNHKEIASSSLLPQNDPTLLFINSGMAPLKNYFLGEEVPDYPNLCNFQPCIRTKDIDDVGDRHHLTIFEMMGSWSIGDYYKEKACELAFKLLVDEFGFDVSKLYVTVYKGNSEKGLLPDHESLAAWKKVGVKEDHIVMMGEDNFWGPAGETGPCGPCTEVFFDTGEKYGPSYIPGGHFDDEGRYIEIWNAGVFMELNKELDGSFSPLPIKSVDTGSGLERMAMVMNAHDSVYETDLLAPLMDIAKELLLSGKNQQSSSLSENFVKKCRMLADHLRASIMILAEGVSPGHEGRNYIPRRLLRKSIAVLMSSQVTEIDFTKLIFKVIEILSPYYSHLIPAKDMILYNVKNEIDEFAPIVKKGIALIDESLKTLSQGEKFSGQLAFELVTTHGLPLEILSQHLKDLDLEFDEEMFESCYQKHRETSRVISRSHGGENLSQDNLEEILKKSEDTIFVGYERFQTVSQIEKIILKNCEVSQIDTLENFYFVTPKTSFYAESGGQVGDCGKVCGDHFEAEVLDCIKVSGVYLHLAKMMRGKLEKGQEVELIVDEKRRLEVSRNHSATHLLHSALHQVIGKHAVQKGSQVRINGLRFDFQHIQALSSSELDQVEQLVNKWIFSNDLGQTQVMSYENALSSGAMALFGEKYDRDVRVVFMGEKSTELCGGTHVRQTGDIGPFIILNEMSVAKGIRRIEAVTGSFALEVIQSRNKVLKGIQETLNIRPEDMVMRIKDLKKQSAKKSKSPKQDQTKKIAYLEKIEFEIEGLSAFVALLDLSDLSQLKSIGDDLINQGKYKVISLLMNGEKLSSCVWVQKDVTKTIKAKDILNKILAPVGGKGGGKPHFAQGGGKGLVAAKSFIESLPLIF